jgi:hypothetical protein
MPWPTSDSLTRPGAAVPLLWSLALTVALAVAYGPQAWPLVDMHALFANADTSDWSRTLADAFGRGREYRPLQVVLIKLLYEVGGLHLWFYKTLVLLQFTAILAVLVWILGPTGWPRTVAVLVALGCVAGLPSSQILLALYPGNVYSLATLLVLGAAALALHPRMRAIDWAFLPLTLVGLLLLELGALVPVIVTVLWLTRAPGVGRRGVGASWLALAVYAGIRLWLGNSADGLQYIESGLGFTDASRAELGELFANAPYLFAIYNVAASTLTVLFSEPRAGKFKFVESLLHGNTPLWLWVHVISSTLTTVVVGSLLVTRRRLSSRDGQLVALGLTLMACGSALGFLYTRDRIAVLVGIGYAMLLSVALAALLAHVPKRSWGRLVAGAAVVILAGAWTIRDAETWLRVRDTAWETYVEWTDRYETLGGPGRPQTELFGRLRSSALAQVPDDPRDDPSWTYRIFEREISR